METLEEKSKDKLQKICDVLRQKTIEPAKNEANELIEQAKKKAAQIIHDAEEKSKQVLAHAEQEVGKQKSIYENSLKQAGKQALELLRQNVEQELFRKNLGQIIQKNSNNSEIVAEIIRSLLKAVETHGAGSDLSAFVSSSVDAQALCNLLGQELCSKLKDQNVQLGDIKGGAQLKLNQDNIVLDLSDEAIRELLAKFIRKDFRTFLFQ